jgi:hypothetical protein
VVAASVRAGRFEQAAEGARGVRVLVGEREALPPLLRLSPLPVVFVAARDLRQLRVGGGDRLAALAQSTAKAMSATMIATTTSSSGVP